VNESHIDHHITTISSPSTPLKSPTYLPVDNQTSTATISSAKSASKQKLGKRVCNQEESGQENALCTRDEEMEKHPGDGEEGEEREQEKETLQTYEVRTKFGYPAYLRI
jgi:hypothetical protein